MIVILAYIGKKRSLLIIKRGKILDKSTKIINAR